MFKECVYTENFWCSFFCKYRTGWCFVVGLNSDQTALDSSLADFKSCSKRIKYLLKYACSTDAWHSIKTDAARNLVVVGT